MLQQIHYLTSHITLYFGEEVHLTGRVAYDQGGGLLYFVTDEDSEVLSINLDVYGLTTPPGHAWIKDWSEHAGIAKQLITGHTVSYKQTALVGPFDSPAHLVQISN